MDSVRKKTNVVSATIERKETVNRFRSQRRKSFWKRRSRGSACCDFFRSLCRYFFAATTSGPSGHVHVQGDFIYRHHIEPRVQLHVPKEEETFPIPLQYNDVTRELLIQIWTCRKKNVLTIFGMWKKPPKGYVWFGRRLTKNQATTRHDYLWPEVWSKKKKSLSEERKARVGKREAKAQ